MTLPLLILVPLVGGLAAWLVGRRSPDACRWLALLVTTAELMLVLALWARHYGCLLYTSDAADDLYTV